MSILVWLSLVLLVALLALYITWAVREPRDSTPWIRNSFIGGSAAFFVLFIIFTVNTVQSMPRTTHADRINAGVIAGKKAWQKYLCIDCHTILGNGAYYAPDVTKSWDRFLSRSGGDAAAARLSLMAYLQHPPLPTSDRRGMPNVNMSNAEASAMVDFLKWTSEIDTSGWPPKPRYTTVQPVRAVIRPDAAGLKLFAAAGCTGCHSVGGGVVLGPDLLTAANRYDRATLVQWMRDPAVIYRQRGKMPVNAGFPEMPSLEISEHDAGAIADYLIAAGRSQS